MEKKNNLSIRIKFGAAEFEADGATEDVKAARDSFLEFIKECSGSLSLLHVAHKVADNSQAYIVDEKDKKRLNPNYDAPVTYSSFNEMKRNLGLSSNTDLIMGAAYFLSAYDGKETFTSQDIKDLLHKTRNKTKINISQFIAQNISKGLIEEVDSSDKQHKAYRILDTANEWVRQLEEKTNTKSATNPS